MGGKRNRLRRNGGPKSPLRVVNPDENEDADELMKDLIQQLDSRDEAESRAILNELDLNERGDQQATEKLSAKSRFQARQARKAAALAQNYPQSDLSTEERLKVEAEQEEKTIKRVCDELDVRIHEINADGHCLYSAVADQLALLSILPTEQASYATTRHAASTYIWNNPSEFLPFLSEETTGAPNAGNVMSAQAFEQYCVAIRDTGVWGGEPEILALSRTYNVPIHVIQGGPSPVVVHNPRRAPDESDAMDKTRKVVRISYHRRMYGLGEHYNSLRPKGGLLKKALQATLA